MKKLLIILLSTISLLTYAQEQGKEAEPKAEVKQEVKKNNLSPEQVAENFYKEIFFGNSDNIYQYLDDRELKKASEEEQKLLKMFLNQLFVAMKEEMKKHGDEAQGFKSNGAVYNADKNKAEVQITMTIKNKEGKIEEKSTPVKLEKIEGEWRIVMQ